jgi:DNA-binding transcriptional LysR family regulator
VAGFVKDYPRIHIELSLTSRVVDLVAEGFDLAVRAGRLEDSSLIARRVGSADLGLFADPSYLSRHGRPGSIADLVNHDCILFRGKDGRAEWRLNGPSGDEAVQVKGPVSVDDLLVVRQAVEAGIGIGLLPLFMLGSCAKRVAQSSVVRVLPEVALRGSALHVVSPSARHQPARVALFRDFLIESLGNLAGLSAPAPAPVRKLRAR